MVVKRGGEWGTAAAAPADALVVKTDRDLADLVGGAAPRPPLVRGGDLHRSLGSPRAQVATRRLPIDVIRVTAEGWTATAVAHVVVRRRGRLGWWRGRIVGVLNVDHIGDWDAAPRAHPNDGWLDVVDVDGSMSVRARWLAWRRLRSGGHVPHPGITVRRIRAEAFSFDAAVGVWIDGVERSMVRALRVEIDADAALVYV
jgi:hypothetical protein